MARNDEEGADELSGRAEEADVKAIADAIAARGAAKQRPWKMDAILKFGGLQWRPNLTRSRPKAVLHIHVAEWLRSYAIERMEAAHAAGYEIHVATALSGLYDEATLTKLAELDATIHLLHDNGKVDDPAPLLKVLAVERMRVSATLRIELGRIGWELSQQAAPKHRRGRRFEAVIAFLLSQVEDFQIVDINMRTATEELDVVVKQRATQGRCWATIGAPFIVVEAKNWKDPVDQPQVSILLTKMRGKRKTVRLGLLFTASDFTAEAKNQELRFAAEDLTIAFVTGKQMQDWIAAEKGDDFLEHLVERAMLR